VNQPPLGEESRPPQTADQRESRENQVEVPPEKDKQDINGCQERFGELLIFLQLFLVQPQQAIFTTQDFSGRSDHSS